MHGAVLGLVVLLTSAAGGTVVRAVIRRRLAQSGVIECAIRPVDETRPDSAGRWQHGAARAHPGRLEFRPGGPAGARIPRGTARTITVSAIRIEEGRRPSRRQIWSINPFLHIAVLNTPAGKIELAAPPESLTQLRERLQAPTP